MYPQDLNKTLLLHTGQYIYIGSQRGFRTHMRHMDACNQALFRNIRISNVSQVGVESPLLPVSVHKRLLLIPIAIEKSLSTAAFTTATRY